MPIPRSLLVVAVVLLVARVGTGVWEWFHPVEAFSAVSWMRVPDAERAAATDDRPVLYYFGAHWCGPCKVLQREVFADEKVGTRVNETYLPVRVEDGLESDGIEDAEAEALRDRLGVEAFPTLVIVNEGEVLARQQGHASYEATVSFLKSNGKAKP